MKKPHAFGSRNMITMDKQVKVTIDESTPTNPNSTKFQLVLGMQVCKNVSSSFFSGIRSTQVSNIRSSGPGSPTVSLLTWSPYHSGSRRPATPRTWWGNGTWVSTSVTVFPLVEAFIPTSGR